MTPAQTTDRLRCARCQTLFGLHLVLVWVGLRDAQRAEYLADEMAARAGGSTAAAGLLETLMLIDPVEMVVLREARAGGGPARWRVAADTVRHELAGAVAVLRQLSVRDETSLFATHPPTGLRVGMVAARAHRDPAVVLGEAETAHLDAELATHAERVRRDLVWAG